MILPLSLNNKECKECGLTYGKSPNEWFKIWHDVIEREKEITRADLADLTKCSLWTIRALTRDFVNSESYINYRNGKFVWWTPRIEHTLSALSEQDKEDLK